MEAMSIFNQAAALRSRESLVGLKPGATVRVYQKIKEGNKTRLQAFEGLIIARKHGSGPNATITVRKVSGGIGVERIFPLHMPAIDKFEVIRMSRVRRAKLYYIRTKTAKQARRKTKSLDLKPFMIGGEAPTEPATSAEEPQE